MKDLDISLQEKLKPWRRSAWVPQTEAAGAPPLGSKFAGLPFIPAGQEWPACGHCALPLQLFAQINPAGLPAAAAAPFGGRLLQVFFCTNDETMCEEKDNFSPFSSARCVRLLDPAGAVPRAYAVSPVADAYPERAITGWREQDDYPNWEELDLLGVELSDAESDQLADEADTPLQGDKLGGWPAWVQGPNYPACPQCAAPMRPLLQIDSEDNLPYMFGDTGCAYITQCPAHPEVLALGWDCC